VLADTRLLTVASANVNGVRAAVRRGMTPWLAATAPDVLCMQEVRAPDDVVAAALGPGWSGVHAEAEAKGRAGVAVHARQQPVAVRVGLPGFEDQGRWVEADLAVPGGLLTVASVYVHTGEAATPRQEEKYRFLEAVRTRLLDLAADGRFVLACGDLNIAHHEVDLRNWRGNLGKAGFLPDERAWLTGLLEQGFADVGRRLGGDGPGPYTWWSWRGKAFDNDTGWRIDYQLASANLAERAVKLVVDRAPTYAERWSDHAAVVVTYEV
jgi:exodeoxyribonuclease-3